MSVNIKTFLHILFAFIVNKDLMFAKGTKKAPVMNLKHCEEWIIGLTHLYLWCGLKRSSHLTREIFNGDVFKPDCWFHISILCSTFVFVLFFFFFLLG